MKSRISAAMMSSKSDAPGTDRIPDAQERCDRILERIKPYLPPEDKLRPPEPGTWRRGIDLPDDSSERYRFEYCGRRS